MNHTAQQFRNACNVANRPPLLKLTNPGLHKFVRRIAASKGILGGPVTVELFFGTRMTVVLPEITSAAIYTYGLFDETVTWMMLESVHPGQTVLDVGAHFGYFSLLLAHLVGASGKVLAVEPTPSTFAVLSANILGHPTVQAINCAAGDESGSITISDFGVTYSAWNTVAGSSRLPEALSGTSATQRSVNVVQLDKLCDETGLRPDFIKIDAENFEDHVISGLAGVLLEARPAILLETGSSQGLAAARRLLEYGYRPRVSDGPGTMYDWNDDIEIANSRFKDMLFVPTKRT